MKTHGKGGYSDDFLILTQGKESLKCLKIPAK